MACGWFEGIPAEAKNLNLLKKDELYSCQTKKEQGNYNCDVGYRDHFFYISQSAMGDLKNNGVLVKGIIKSQKYHSKSSLVDVVYTFKYLNKQYENNSNSGIVNSSIFIDKSFPVIVSQSTLNSTMLITPKHFKTFDIPFPDSLKWVLRYIDE